jgi:hypothetical protein
MKHFYRGWLVALAFLMGFAQMDLVAQQTFIIGDQNSATTNTLTGYPTPYGRFYGGMRTYYLVRATELQAAGFTGAGDITEIGFYVTALNGADASPNFRISMLNTTITNLTAGAVAGMTTVFGPQTYSPTVGTNAHALSSPFRWDGTSNLLIEICHHNQSGCAYTYNASCRLTPATGFTSSSYSFNDCASACDATNFAGWSLLSSRPVLYLKANLGGIVSSFPSDAPASNYILTTNLYDGVTFPRPSLTMRIPSGATAQITYRIVGPLPSTNVVYQATTTDPNVTTIPVTSTSNNPFTFTFSNATGALAGTGANAGALDARTAVGGSYRLEATFAIPAFGINATYNKGFVIAYQNDLAMVNIVVPRATPYKYLRGVDIPVAVTMQNVGLNSVTSMQATAEITDISTNTVVYRDTINYNNTPGMATGATYFAQFRNFNSLNAGTYCLKFNSTLFNGNDENVNNNALPSGNACWNFDVQYATELSADAIINPPANGQVYVNKPFNVLARFKNNGAIDQSDIPTRMTVEKFVGGSWNLVYSVDKTIPDLAFTNPNTTTLLYDPWTPTSTGRYRVCVTISAPDDPVTSNNQLCNEFDVVDALSGTYTIGTLNSGGSRNFTTIQNAVDALYIRGVSGAVTFELTDNSYTVGSLTAVPAAPALDLSSKILGVNSINTVTFKPSLLQSLSRGSVSIRLQSNLGIGVYFGQNVSPANPNAIQNQFKSSNLYSNSAGHLIFDGGSQKSFRFQLDVGTASPTALPQRAVFMLGRGSSNVAVRNSLIENFPQSTASYASALPVVRYLAPNFTFENDLRSLSAGPESYSAGIVSRSVVPNINGNNSLGLDTLSNDNNQFVNNDISGFGYGIVSLGVGPLFYNDIAPNGNPRFQRYYNKNTVIKGNVISSVRRAGIYTGYGENEQITDNRIINVGIGSTGVGGQAAGIMVGGEARPGQICYNSIKPVISRNEISNIASDVAAQGIYIEQTMNSFVNPAGGSISFPNVNEAAYISGNMIYAITRTTQNAVAAGIHLLTMRSATATGLTKLITPQVASYNTRGDSIVNNTVMITGDAVSNGLSVVGIGVQHAVNAVMLNNAVAVSGASSSVNTAAGNVFAALFYQGISPKSSAGVAGLLPAVSGGLSSNRNAFFAPSAAIVRYIETDNANAILTLGTQSDYVTLGQWKGWTAQDINSVVGNFVSDHSASNTTPSRMRINTNPIPIGSVLDRRGERLGANTYDLDGDPRGLNGARYTIGADEFIGRLYVNDVEAIEIINPVAYRAGAGNFADAEYVMTKAPVNVTARMRNNGSGSQAGITIQAEIRDQNNAVVATNSKVVTIASGESIDINFDFNFMPMTYGDMGQTAPAPFAAMSRNVTPVYTINVFTPIDENTANNATNKPVRFYLMRSPIRMVNSVVNVTSDPNSTSTPWNEIVGRLNSDSLFRALSYLGLNSTSYDVFDRNGWEPRAVNYASYRSLFWAEDTARLTRLQRTDLRMFLANGVASDKKNLVVASQEILGKHIGLDATNDEQFVRYVLRATNATTGALKGSAPTDRTPRAAGYDNQQVLGVTLAQGIREIVAKTSNTNDPMNPMPSLMRIYSDNQTNGLARTAYSYVTRDAGVTDSMMGIATNALNYNVVFFGVDWRHMPRTTVNQGSERIMRAIIEFIERSQGTVVPVELVAFNAQRSGNNVNIAWETASEKNSSYFDVERAAVTMAGTSAYTAVRTVPAQGTSTVSKDYNVVDANVSTASAWSYRLKMVDLDGTSRYSQEVLVSAEAGTSSLTVSPNPASTTASITVELAGSGMTEVTLVDMNGRTVATIAQADLSGAQQFKLNTDGIASGSYTVVVKQNGSITSQALQIVK